MIMSGFFGGDVAPTGGGAAKTWSWDPASETLDDPDLFTYEFGDDVLTDWFQDGDGILESFEIAGPVGLGPLTAIGVVALRLDQVRRARPTRPLSARCRRPPCRVSVDDVIVYLKDGAIFIGDTPYTLESNQISDALYSFTLTGEQEVDQKRWANGDQSFDTDAMVPGARTIELECRFAKTTQTVGAAVRVRRLDERPAGQPLRAHGVHRHRPRRSRASSTRSRSRCRCATTPAPRTRKAATPS